MPRRPIPPDNYQLRKQYYKIKILQALHTDLPWLVQSWEAQWMEDMRREFEKINPTESMGKTPQVLDKEFT
jgi:hypothetical protein